MQVSTHFDAGVCGPVRISGNEVTFDLRPHQQVLNVLLRDMPNELTLHFLLDPKGAPFLIGQGILLSDDGVRFRAEPVRQTGDERWSITLLPTGPDLRVANRHVYGRDAVDRLLCDVHGHPRIRPRMLTRQHRSVICFECGEDDGHKPVHYLIAGEDVSEGPGSIVADHMVRLLAAGETDLLDRAIVRLVPVASLHCAARPSSTSYDTLDGQAIYGAATWGDECPPPEYAMIRDLVNETIAERRLGLLLTMHSWLAEYHHTGIEFCTIGGEHQVSADRISAATAAMDRLMADVPRRQTFVGGKCWHPGLARDYLLARHNAVTYRIEFTSFDNPACDFLTPARAIIRNLASIDDWSFVLPQRRT